MFKLFFCLILFCQCLIAEDVMMTVTTTTGNEKHSGTNDLKIYVQINENELLKYYLNDPKRDDFKIGATETFPSVKIPVAVKDIRTLSIGVDSGGDAWLMRNLIFEFQQGKKRSKSISFKRKVWLSAEKSDRGSVTKRNFKLKSTIRLQ